MIRRALHVVEAPEGGTPALAEAVDWFRSVSDGHALLDVDHRSPWPASRRLALLGRPDEVRCLVGKVAEPLGPPLLVIGAPGSRPHCWRTAHGRPYALVACDHSVAVFAHELGHLLFGWPDLRLPPGSAVTCLMAPLESGRTAIPSAPMRVMAGWEKPEPLPPDRPGSLLPERRAFEWADLLIERQGPVLAGFRLRGKAVSLAFTARCSVEGSALAQVSCAADRTKRALA